MSDNPPRIFSRLSLWSTRFHYKALAAQVGLVHIYIYIYIYIYIHTHINMAAWRLLACSVWSKAEAVTCNGYVHTCMQHFVSLVCFFYSLFLPQVCLYRSRCQYFLLAAEFHKLLCESFIAFLVVVAEPFVATGMLRFGCLFLVTRRSHCNVFLVNPAVILKRDLSIV